MRVNSVASLILAVASLSCAAEITLAQNAPAPPPLKTIGVPGSEKAQIVPSLIVMNSRGAALQGQTLTLLGISPNSIVFADRPIRAAGHDLTTHLLEEWSGGDSFGKDPPNATVSVLNKDGSVKDAVVVLKSPKMDGDKLTFEVQVLEGDLTGADGPAAVFIDIIGRPLTPLSFAGVARRTAFRGAMYAGAATAGAVAAGAAGAAYYHPYGYYPPPACGYYPYPPCY